MIKKILLHHSLKFTIERETNCEIPFLDMKLIRLNDRLESTWYTKHTNTGLVMNYHALVPNKYKWSVISWCVYRIYRAGSSWKHFYVILERAKTIFLNNQYPPSFYEPIIKGTLMKIIQPDENETNESTNESDVSITDSEMDHTVHTPVFSE